MDAQLELNLENRTPHELQISIMQQQIDAMHESVGKVRRNLFAQMGEVKKLLHALQAQNQELQATVRLLKNEPTEWVYCQGDSLFDVRAVG